MIGLDPSRADAEFVTDNINREPVDLFLIGVAALTLPLVTGVDAHETLGDMVRRVLETVEAAKDSGDLGLYVLSFYRDPEED